jgi:Family of unknown function (DUF6365)
LTFQASTDRRGIKALLVTPVEQGSGETITAVHIAQDLIENGHEVLFLASPFARRFIDPSFQGRVQEFGPEGPRNHEIWKSALREFCPDAVVFADYPLLFFPSGVSRLASEPGWVESLDNIGACLVTLDHFGFAQHEMSLFFGPAHLTTFQYQKFPPIPSPMEILLPCPMHEPDAVEGRKGEPFRYWSVPLGVTSSARQRIRRRYLENEDDLLVFHSVPNWAWQAAEALGLPFYEYLPRILEEYLGSVQKQITIVSVNNGELLASPSNSRVRFINLNPIPTAEFEELLFSADLMITENRLSISMGKAICGFQVCAVLKNSYRILDLIPRLKGTLRDSVLAMENIRLGTVYPYEVFPSGMTELLEEIVLYKNNSLTKAFCDTEVFGGDETAEMLRRLLVDQPERKRLQQRQQSYVDKLQALPTSTKVLCDLVEKHRSKR